MSGAGRLNFGMIRKQILLREDQVERISKLSVEAGVSLSEMIRRVIDLFIAENMRDPEEIRRRAMAAVGSFHSGKSDISERHDDYLAEVFAECLDSAEQGTPSHIEQDRTDDR